MTLQSMTGFARVEGTSGRTRWAWELRSVNGKGLDLRLRLPPGLEALEADVRRWRKLEADKAAATAKEAEGATSQ